MSSMVSGFLTLFGLLVSVCLFSSRDEVRPSTLSNTPSSSAPTSRQALPSFVNQVSVPDARRVCNMRTHVLTLSVSAPPISDSGIAEVHYTINSVRDIGDLRVTASLPKGAHLVYQHIDTPSLLAGGTAHGTCFIWFPTDAPTYQVRLIAQALVRPPNQIRPAQATQAWVPIYVSDLDLDPLPVVTSGAIRSRDIPALYE